MISLLIQQAASFQAHREPYQKQLDFLSLGKVTPAVDVRARRGVGQDYLHAQSLAPAVPQPAREINGGNFKSIKGPTHAEN